MRYLQREMAVHHQPVRRASDHIVVETQPLYWEGDYSLDGLLDVDFRAGTHGRLMWTVEGVDYYKQYLPPSMADLAAPPELLLAEMAYAGVDRAVIQAGHLYGELDRACARAKQRFPGRFWAVAQLREWKADQASELVALDRALGELGLDALWFDTVQLSLHKRSEMVDGASFAPLWERARRHRVPIFWSVSAAEPGVTAYLTQFRAFARWLKQHPDIPCLLTHGVPLFLFWEGDAPALPEEVWLALAAPNLLYEVLLPIRAGAMWDYPYEQLRPWLRQLYERLGPAKLAWGSDMPNVGRHCTYRQSLDYLRRACDFIPEHEVSMICGGNIARLLTHRA